jgi:hypothetical protein
VLPRWVPGAEEVALEEAKWEHRGRATASTFRELAPSTTKALIEACRARGVTASAALCAAAVLGASDVMGSEGEAAGGLAAGDSQGDSQERYKLLQALDMRTLNFGEGGIDAPGAREDWSLGTVVAGTGSLDILVDLPPQAGEAVRSSGELEPFWTAASACHGQTREWIRAGWGRESLLLFSSGWAFMNMNRVVELGSQDRATLGRAYSAGVSNVGVYAHGTRHADLTLSAVHFGISQTVSAPAISISSVTVDGKLCLTVQYATPIWTDVAASAYADAFVRTLEMAAEA